MTAGDKLKSSLSSYSIYRTLLPYEYQQLYTEQTFVLKIVVNLQVAH